MPRWSLAKDDNETHSFYIDIITDGSVKLGRREEGVHSAIRKYECDAVNV